MLGVKAGAGMEEGEGQLVDVWLTVKRCRRSA